MRSHGFTKWWSVPFHYMGTIHWHGYHPLTFRTGLDFSARAFRSSTAAWTATDALTGPALGAKAAADPARRANPASFILNLNFVNKAQVCWSSYVVRTFRRTNNFHSSKGLPVLWLNLELSVDREGSIWASLRVWMFFLQCFHAFKNSVSFWRPFFNTPSVP